MVIFGLGKPGIRGKVVRIELGRRRHNGVIRIFVGIILSSGLVQHLVS